jgi:hypothetical protein
MEVAMSVFTKATKIAKPAKVALSGASGSGKTMSALKLAKGFGGKIALADTENFSSTLYADEYEFDVLRIEPPFTVDKFIQAIDAAEKEGYATLILDSFTHPWAGEGGLLDLKGAIEDASGNGWTAWRKVTPKHNVLVSRVLQSPLNIIVTLRAKMEYAQEKDGKGKSVVVKLGMMPIQREGVDYEFDLVFDLDAKHYAKTSKVRSTIFDDFYAVLDEKVGAKIIKWVSKGEKTALPAAFEPEPQPEPQPVKSGGNGDGKAGGNGKSNGKGKATTKGSTAPPTEQQVRAMFDRAKELQLDMGVLKRVMEKRYKITTSLDLAPQHITELMGDNKKVGVIQLLAEGLLTLDKVTEYPADLSVPF